MIGALTASGAQKMGIALPSGAAEQFAAFHTMLIQKNAVMNLTRVPDAPEEAVDRNYLDSLAPIAQGLLAGARSLIDVGAGAGFPGIPLSIALPNVRVVMIDALKKRVAFLSEVIKALGLNAEAHHLRAEDAARRSSFRDQFDIATARAVAALPTLIELSLPLVRPGGALIAYKGPTLDEELLRSAAALEALSGRAHAPVAVHIPGRDWDHRLVRIDKLAPTPAAFPRKAGQAERRPLMERPADTPHEEPR